MTGRTKKKSAKTDQTKSLFGEEAVAAPVQPPRHVIRVAFDSGVDSCFDYAVPPHLWPIEPGRRVEVPFGRGNKMQQAFCVELLDGEQAEKSRQFQLKQVRAVVDEEPLLSEELIQLADWISRYYVCPLGQVLSAMLPAAVKKGVGVKKEKLVYLIEPHGEAVDALTSDKQRQLVEMLQLHGALDADRAVPRAKLLDEVGCTDAPLKTLIRRRIVALESREVLKSLPVIPPRLQLDTRVVVLNEDQLKALKHLSGQLASGEFGVTLLHGVTDSGKTEVYIRAIEEVVSMGRQAVVLLPEIALTAQTVNRFSQRFERIAVMHSQLSAPQRHAQWRMIKSGQADVVIGARSAIFAPLERLGLVVVDEEHEPSYKQDTVPRYHGRDVAIKRAHLAGAHCLLGSATPSLETLTNTRTRERFYKIDLPKRVMDLPMPEMHLIDMGCEKGAGSGATLISEELEKEIKLRLEKREQIILLLNRRGYSNFVYCPSCHHSLQCRNCDVTLTFHKRGSDTNRSPSILGAHMAGGYAICHYCMSKTLVPKQCPLCGKGMTMIGLGSQRLIEELEHKIPEAKVVRVDSDAMEGTDAESYYRILRDFSDGSIDILAGTQMLAKGLHFPNVTLVGVISADTALAIPDFRSNERTFQLISQVAGRAGRSEKPGRVIVQTFLPDQPSIQFAMENDYEGFVKAELEHRKACNLPPYWRMAIVGLRDEKFDRLEKACDQMGRRIGDVVAKLGLNTKIRGPMPATISRVHGFHRMQFILQAPDAAVLSQLFSTLRAYGPTKPAVTVTVDVDPIHLL